MKVAVVLCGSGYKDGSEIRESVSVLLSLSQHGAQFQCFAPDDFQTDVVNCLSGEAVTSERRHMMVEAARIARGDVKSLTDLKASDFDAVILPGGYGAAKNLCNFAFKGSAGEVRNEVKNVLHDFHLSKKPIGAVCIAPAILALAFKGTSLTLTVGETSEASQEIEKLGHKHQICPASSSVVDLNHKVVTTPAYMYDQAPLADIFMGIDSLVGEVLKLTK